MAGLPQVAFTSVAGLEPVKYLRYGESFPLTVNILEDQILAQVTVFDAKEGDANIVDMCTMPALDALARGNRAPWRRVLIDTGPINGAITEAIYHALTQRGLPLRQLTTAEKAAYGGVQPTPEVPWLDEVQITHFDNDHVGNAGDVLAKLGVFLGSKFADWQARAIARGLTYQCKATFVPVPAAFPVVEIAFDHADVRTKPNGDLNGLYLYWTVDGVKKWREELGTLNFKGSRKVSWSDSKKDGEVIENVGTWQDHTTTNPADRARWNFLRTTWSEALYDKYDGWSDLYDQGKRAKWATRPGTLTITLTLSEKDGIQRGFEVTENASMKYEFEWKTKAVWDAATKSAGLATSHAAKKPKTTTPPVIKGKRSPDNGVIKTTIAKLLDECNTFDAFIKKNPPVVDRAAQESVPEIPAVGAVGPGGAPVTLAGSGWDVQRVSNPSAQFKRDLRRYLVNDQLKPGEEQAEAELTVREVILNRASIVTTFSRPDAHLPDSLLPGTGFRMLFTGDAYDQGCDIRRTIQGWNADATGQPPPMYYNVLKVPHHGSSKTAYGDFYEYVRAEVYLICGDHHNKSGNPKYATLRHIVEGFRATSAHYRARPSGQPFRIFFSSPRADEDYESALLTQTSAAREISHVESDYTPSALYNYEMWMLKPKANVKKTKVTYKTKTGKWASKWVTSVPYGSIVFYRDASGRMREMFDPSEWELIAGPP